MRPVVRGLTVVLACMVTAWVAVAVALLALAALR